jgi:hypothetical protein
MNDAPAIRWLIRPGVGLDDLLFGSSLEEVQLYLGEPEDRNESLLGVDPSVAWYYWNLGVTAYFYGEDGFRFGAMQVERADVELFGRRWIGLPEMEVRMALAALCGEGQYEVMESADHPTLHWLRYEAHGLDFWFKVGRLNSIQWGYLLGPDEEPCWPETP